MPPQATAQADDLSKYEVKPGPQSVGTDDLSKYEVKPQTDKTYHSNPSSNNWAPLNDPSRTTSLSSEEQAKRDIVAPARHQPIPKAVQYAMEAAPMLSGIGEAVEAGGGAIPVLKTIGEKVIAPAAKSVIGATAGGYLGREAGRWVGHPELGGTIGGLAGGAYGAYKGIKGEPIAIPSWRTVLNNATQVGEREAETIPIGRTPGTVPGDIEAAGPKTIPERLREHMGDERTPFPPPPYTPQGPPRPIPTIRRVPGEIDPEYGLSSGNAEPIMENPQAPRSGTSALPGGGVIKRPPIGLLPEKVTTPAPDTPQGNPTPFGKTLKTIGELIEEVSGTQRLQPDVPLIKQLKPPPGNRVTIPLREEFGSRTAAPLKIGAQIPEEVGTQMGAPPLKPDVPLRGQLKPSLEEPVQSKQATLEEKYPDRSQRQMVHILGEDMVRAIGDDTETMKAAAALRGPDIRQAAINSGEDMGQVSVGNRKATGNQVSPQELLSRMLKKGISPQEIIRLAKQPIEERTQ